MQALRSLAFNILFFGWTALLLLATCPFAAFMSGHRMRRLAAFWMRVTHALLRHVVGLDHEIVGRERLPEGPVLFASKHQSSWETMIFHVIRPDTVIGLKDELRRIPIFGWYLLLGGNIRIDRAGAAQALRSLVTGAKEAAAQGCSILIFPE